MLEQINLNVEMETGNQTAWFKLGVLQNYKKMRMNPWVDKELD